MQSPMGCLPAPGLSGGQSPQAKAQLLHTVPPSPDSDREGYHWVTLRRRHSALRVPWGQGQPRG